MSYQTFEVSDQSSEPLELFLFMKGAIQYTYCTANNPIDYSGMTYLPAPISRDRIKQSKDVLKNGLLISLPRDNPLALNFVGFVPDQPTTITIFRGQPVGASFQFIVFWKGRVVSASTTDNTVKLECESLFTSLNRVGLRAKFELTCRHALYGTSCKVNDQAFKFTGEIFSVSQNGLDVSINGASNWPNGYFTGGKLASPGGAIRFITSHVGSVISMSRPISSLSGMVDIFPGCDHLLATCDSKFNNLVNFGGFPYIPQRNPFDGSSII